ncbi:MAG TPA: hypothetical protein H9881_06910 [Candidatus Stackebrandtia excrementipullorum]|nr:hypothetical protein [Candidatus Stackebrandtia excrementipullorum]
MWSTVASHLAKSHRVFLWDMPGYGDSEKYAAVGFATQTSRLATLLDHWRLDRPWWLPTTSAEPSRSARTGCPGAASSACSCGTS